MKNSIFKGKSLRTRLFAALTAILIPLLLAFNLILTYIGGESLLFADMTREGFYTLTPKMEEVCSDILEARDAEGNYKLNSPVKVTFCTDPDRLVSSDAMRPTYFMALRLRNRFENFEVECVSLLNNPERVAPYKKTSLDSISAGDIIVSYGAKYRVVDATSFWTENDFSYDGEYRLASLMLSLTAISSPVAYFLTDHGETYYDAENPESEMSASVGEFYDLLTECGFTVKNAKISEWESVPEDCALLIINNPTEDFVTDPDRYGELGYVSDLEKLDRYMIKGNGAIIVNKDYRTASLKNLEAFAYEWGIVFENEQVRDTAEALENALDASLGEGFSFAATYDTDEKNYGMAHYGDYATLDSAPKMIFTDTGYFTTSYIGGYRVQESGDTAAERNYVHFIGTTDGAKAYSAPGSTSVSSGEGAKTLAVLAVRKTTDVLTGNNGYSYMLCFNSAETFSNKLLGNAAYANRDILASLVTDISRTETYATDELGSISLNSTSFGGKQTVSEQLSATDTKYYNGDGTLGGIKSGISSLEISAYTVLVFAAPVCALVFGIIVFIRRKFL